MSKYRAIVSITFDDDDLEELAEVLEFDNPDAQDVLQGSLDNFVIGYPLIEQIFKDGEPTIRRLSGGIMVEVSEDE